MVESPQKGWKTLWEKGEIASSQQFLFSPLCFQKICTADRKKQVLLLERVNTFPNNKFYSSKLKEFAGNNFKFDRNGIKGRKHFEKRKNCSGRAFFPFPSFI